MIKEYFVVARYLARINDGEDPEESVYKKLENDLTKLIKFDRHQELKDMFTIIQGAEITEEEYENE